MGQDAAIERLTRRKEQLKMRREYEMRRDYILRGFTDLGLECFQPRGHFVFRKILHRSDHREFPCSCCGKRKSPRFQAVRLARAAKAMCAAAMPLRSIRSKSLSNELRSFAAALAPYGAGLEQFMIVSTIYLTNIQQLRRQRGSRRNSLSCQRSLRYTALTGCSSRTFDPIPPSLAGS